MTAATLKTCLTSDASPGPGVPGTDPLCRAMQAVPTNPRSAAASSAEPSPPDFPAVTRAAGRARPGFWEALRRSLGAAGV
jgi:hypothetical protein